MIGGYRICTGEEMRESDRITIEEWGVPSLVLMENAGRGVVEGLTHKFPDWKKRTYIIACGRGNNGGDGLVVARHLKQRGVRHVYPVILGDKQKVRGDAKWNLDFYEAQFEEVPSVNSAEEWHGFFEQCTLSPGTILIDAVLGTGLTRPLEGFLAEWVLHVNHLPVCRIAIDIPTGLFAGSGEIPGPAFRAHETFTMGAPKYCMVFPPALEYCGNWHVVTIGTPEKVLHRVSRLIWPTRDALCELLPVRQLESHKGHYGRIFVIGGRPGTVGAVWMAGMSALKAGGGLVTLCVPQSVQSALLANPDELMTLGLPDEHGAISVEAMEVLRQYFPQVDILVVGPGLGIDRATEAFMGALLTEWKGPIVIDADGLNILSRAIDLLDLLSPDAILTPHPGEMARLTGLTTADVQKDRLSVVKELSEQTNAIVVLKGYRTLVAHPSGHVVVNPTGNPGMASAGMGDILSGIIGGLLGQLEASFEAAVLGVYLHGLAGDLGAEQSHMNTLTATDLLATLAQAFRIVEQGDETWHV